MLSCFAELSSFSRVVILFFAKLRSVFKNSNSRSGVGGSTLLLSVGLGTLGGSEEAWGISVPEPTMNISSLNSNTDFFKYIWLVHVENIRSCFQPFEHNVLLVSNIYR